MKSKKRIKLKHKREERGFTQSQVAQHIGISTNYYQKLESGDRMGTPYIWDDLEDLFGVSQRVLRAIGEFPKAPHFINKPR